MKAAGVVMITDNDMPVHNPQLMRIAMEYARDFDMPLASHCEVKELSAGGVMHEGSVSYSLGLGGIPACSEEILPGAGTSGSRSSPARICTFSMSRPRSAWRPFGGQRPTA